MSAKRIGKPQRETLSSDRQKDRARMAMLPEVNSAIVMGLFNVSGEQDLGELVGALRKSGDAIVKGDTQGIERMLVSQAHALDAMFVKLARRALQQEGLAQMDAFLKFTLRAQSQCRATLETLATIKNPPPVAFVRQANIANGPQQVNNGEPPARAEQNANRPSEVSRLTHEGQSLDFGTPAQAGRGDPPLEAVASIERA